MPFPVRLLSVDEKVAIETRPHWIYLLAQLTVFLAMLAAVISVTVGLDDFPLPAIVVIGAVAGLSAVALGIRLIRWATTYYLFSNHRIIYWKGFPRWRGIQLELELVEEIEVIQTFGQRVLGVGKLEIRSIIDDHVRTFASVPRPARVREEVHQLLRQPEDPSAQISLGGESAISAAGEEDPSASLDIPDQIRKLYELVELGILSEAEFQEKKRDLLGRL